jgi:hypothetical protein
MFLVAAKLGLAAAMALSAPGSTFSAVDSAGVLVTQTAVHVGERVAVAGTQRDITSVVKDAGTGAYRFRTNPAMPASDNGRAFGVTVVSN